jgi:hypothetical protein
MKTRGILAVALAIIASAAVAYAIRSESLSSKSEWTPTKDPAGWKGNYVPTDLLDAMTELDRSLPRSGKRVVRELPEGGTHTLHMGLGMAMRNAWGLSRHSRLATYFEAHGVLHPDDMSAIVLEAYWAHLHGRSDPAKYVYARTPMPNP